jgi:uncharacterized protein
MTGALTDATAHELTLRPLTSIDEPALQRLMEADSAYSERVTGAPPASTEARDLLTGRPPELPSERKCVLGAFQGETLIAVVDLLRGWPEPSTAHIGLFQVHVAHHGTGLGRRVHTQLLRWLRQWTETTSVRAAVVATNAEQAEPFWAAMGYTSTESRPYVHGPLETTVRIWVRTR